MALTIEISKCSSYFESACLAVASVGHDKGQSVELRIDFKEV